MCRLYGFHANEPTRIECSLIHSQNALLEQGIRDREGLSHGHGWGIATYPDGLPKLEREAWAAWHGEHFKKAAKRIYAKTVIAHVRRATVGPPARRNTHPFVHGRWAFAHNGTIPEFEHVRPRILEAMDPLHRSEIRGSTDSEYIFRYLLTLWGHNPNLSMIEILRKTILQISDWVNEVGSSSQLSLNILWSNGSHLVGSRLNRTLWYLEREGVVDCEICGQPHVHHDPKQYYRAVEVASEPITEEDWLGVPNGSLFIFDPDIRIHFETIGLADVSMEGRGDEAFGLSP